MLEEVNRLTSLVENLLTIARADAGQMPFRRSVFGAMELAREASGLLEVLIEDKHQQVSSTEMSGSVWKAIACCCGKRWSISSTTP